MNPLSLSPGTLLALSLITLPALAVSSPPTSSNDPFRAIVVVYRAQQPAPPLCCLKPLPTIDSPEGPEDVLLSFEEWKSKQLQAGPQSVPAKPKPDSTSNSDTPSKTNVQNADVPLIDSQSLPDLLYLTSDDALPPHFRVPIIDRFNYANMDCSARVHTTHKSAKSASSILSAKKDKYMLSPCSAQSQFVVVELCDDIRIDTVQLANFEFFSGAFKDFSVSVAKTYTGTDEGWTPAGTYRAKNVRGVQSFHPPTSLRDFYRYIRVDFHSHYGHEYYCPVSLLRVYGLTHLEEWKWDTWLDESRTRLKDSGGAVTPKVVSNGDTNVSVAQVAPAEFRSITSLLLAEPTSTPARETSPSINASSTHARGSGPMLGEGTSMSGRTDGAQQTLAIQSTGIHSVTEAISSLSSMSSPISVVSDEAPLMTDHSYSPSHDSETHAFTSLSSPAPSTSPVVQQTPLPTPSPQQWGGESIYRTIMNRLTTLETSHTLYAQYVEEQTAGVREVLRKLNEELGRLESISRMQAQMYQRTVHEWERQRLRLQLEHGELLSRVNHLSDEVVLEKRLGIAQLCLLLAVLVFIGLTRGAPAAQHPPTVHRSTREWGVRSLSFGSSGDRWNPLRRRSRSPTEQIANVKAEKATVTDVRPLFPGTSGSPDPKSSYHYPHAGTKAFSPAVSHKRTHTHTHGSLVFRTPTKPHLRPLEMPHTLPRAEPLPLARSHSSSTSSHPQGRSARRWARSAHLHEIKAWRERRGSAAGSGGGKRTRDRENEREETVGDVFHVPSLPCRVKAKDGLGRLPLMPLAGCAVVRSGLEEGVADTDVWIDTDVDEDDEDDSVVSERVVVLNPPEQDVFG